jgi:hypothetical protein
MEENGPKFRNSLACNGEPEVMGSRQRRLGLETHLWSFLGLFSKYSFSLWYRLGIEILALELIPGNLYSQLVSWWARGGPSQ